MIWKIIVALGVAFFAGDVSARRGRIINGIDTNIELFPYQVSLRYNNRHFCGGSIISEKHILTAAHCVVEMEMIPPYENFIVVTGTTYSQEAGNEHDIANATVHSDYWTDQNSAVNDVAIITLKDTIAFDEYQQKINLPKEHPVVGQKANLTGWGLAKQFPSNIFPDQLQLLKTKLISNEECQEKVIDPTKTKIYDTEICTTRKDNSGACMGDSGGPLASNGEVIGIASWFDGTVCAGNTPDVFVNVYKFIDYIESVIKENL